MAEIKIQAVLERENFDSQVKKLNDDINDIANKPIKIKVEAQGIEGDVKALAQLATAQARVAEAEAKIASAHARSEAAAAKKVQTMTQLAKVQAEVEKSANKVAEAEAKSQGAVQKEHEKTQQVVARTVKAQIEGDSRVAAEKEKTIQSENRLQQQISRTEQEANKANAAQARGAKEVKDATDQVAESTQRVGEMLTAMAVRGAWRIITSEIKDALNAMKEVDKELVTIRKVTGFSNEKIAGIGQSAYNVASQYGVLPQNYLASVANFARAGYKETSTSLGELAVKTQLVGDVSQETANQMLLAVDAAYKYGGSAEQLSAVLDGMNEIDNNFATSIEKISSGIGKVTSIAAQAHVSIGELSAAIGTITAVTQRSGTEAATALRALFLNIMGDTKTEIEDGAKWTAGEIQGLRDVIAQYAPEALNAAAATGTLINPMEAIAGLSKSMKDGLLTEQQLMAMVTDIGGKLRSSQLLALIQNWDMYEAQLEAFNSSAGSAGREVANMLDSWDVKANQLSTSWTKMVADVMDTGFVKGTLDFLKSVVTLLDAGGGIPAKLLAIASAVTAIGTAIKTITASEKLTSIFGMLKSFILNSTTWAIAGGAVALGGIIGLINQLVVTQQELDDAASKSADAYDAKRGSMMSVNEQIARNYYLIQQIEGSTESLTDKDKDRLAVLKQQTAELEAQARVSEIEAGEAGLQAAKDAAAAMSGRSTFDKSEYDYILSNWGQKEQWSLYGINTSTGNINELLAYYTKLRETKTKIDEKLRGLKPGKDDDEIKNWSEHQQYVTDKLAEVEPKINKYIKDNADNAVTIDGYLDTFVRNKTDGDRTTDQRRLLKVYEGYVDTSNQINDILGTAKGTAATGETVGTTPAPTAWATAIGEQDAKFRAVNQAIKEFNETGIISVETYDAMANAGVNVTDAMIDMGNGYVVAAEDLRKMSNETKDWYDKYGVSMPETMASIGDEADTASGTLLELANNALTLQDNAYGAAKALQDLQDTMKAAGEKGDTLDAWQKQYASAMALVGEGAWNANQVRGLADFVFGAENIDAMGGYRAAAKELGNDLVKNLLSGDARETLQWLHKTYGDLINDGNNLIKQNEDGTWSFMVNDMKSLSQALGVSEPLLSAFMDKLSLFGDVQDEEGINKLLDGMAEGVDKVGDGTKKVNLESFVSQMLDLGKNSAQIRELLNQMANMPEIKVEGDTSKLQEIIDKEIEIKNKADEGANIDITATNNVEGPASEAEETVEIPNQNIDIGATNSTKEEADAAKKEVDIPDKNIDIGATNSTEVEAGAAEETVDIPNVNIDISATDNASGTAGTVKRAVEEIPTEINIKIKATTDGLPTEETTSGLGTVGGGLSTYGLDAVSGAAPFIPNNASGTNFAEGGPTLVNELGPELIAQNGRAFIANGGKPTITNLARGAIVYNAEDTRRLLVGGGISSYGIESKAGVFDINMNGGGDDKPKPPTGGGKTKKKKTDDEWWKIMQEQYEYALAKAKDQIAQIDLKITHIKNEIADAKRPLEEQIKEYEKANKQIERQITLLNRAKERMTKPIQDEIDALKAQKEIQDEQLALEEKQKAVEEARAALQNAQQERTIRFYNQETGHWEWMADQKAIEDAQKNVDSAEKALADQEFNMQIKELERQKDAIEKEFDDQVTQLEEQKLINEDAIYALNEAIDAIDEAYAPELNTLEREKELMDRELADTEAEWAHLQFQREKKPKGNLNKAANKLGKKGATAKEIIESMTASIKDIETLAASGEINAISTDSLIYGSPAMYSTMGATGISRSGSTDSHDIIINGIALTNQSAYDSFTEGLAALGIYAGE